MKARVFVFGNPLIREDSIALRTAKELKGEIKGIIFEEIVELDELEKTKKEEWKNIVLMDCAEGIKSVQLIPLERIKKQKIFSLHDFDLGLYLQLKQKIGEIGKVKIIGIPLGMQEEKAAEQTKKLLKRLFKVDK